MPGTIINRTIRYHQSAILSKMKMWIDLQIYNYDFCHFISKLRRQIKRFAGINGHRINFLRRVCSLKKIKKESSEVRGYIIL